MKELATKEDYEAARFLASFLLTGRSFIIASRVLEHLDKKPIVVAGCMHAGQIKQFLENSRVAIRYATMVKNVMEKNKETRNRFYPAIVKGIKIFEETLKKQG